MSLVAYLRGTPPLSNPALARWRLLHRHAEGGPWREVDAAAHRRTLDDAVRAPAFALDHGDLVGLRGPTGAMAGFWVCGRGGELLDAGKVPSALGAHGRDWEAAWEGDRAKPQALLTAARDGSDPRRLVRAAVDCTDLAAEAQPERPPEAGAALDAARAWCRGEKATDEVHRLGAEAWTVATQMLALDGGRTAGVFGVVEATRAAACAATAARHPNDASNAAFYAASAARARGAPPPGAAGRALADAAVLATRRALATRVRAWLPLSTVLLGAAGAPVPLPPGA